MKPRLAKILAIVAGLGVLALAGLFFFLNFIRDDAPPEFSLRTEEELAATTTTQAAEEFDGINGPWVVGTGSQAGYRVVEDFVGGAQDFEAVGRTSEVTGSLTIDGTVVTTAEFVVDVASITSDSDNRDTQFRNRVMKPEEFPQSVFVLTSPLDFGSVPEDGVEISVAGEGDLTLRDVTRSVPVAITARLIGAEIEVVGSIDVLFSDFGIDNPTVERLIIVRDEGKVEFQLIFRR